MKMTKILVLGTPRELDVIIQIEPKDRPKTDIEKKGRLEKENKTGAVAREKEAKERELGAVKFKKMSDDRSKTDIVESTDQDTTTITEATDGHNTGLHSETKLEKVT